MKKIIDVFAGVGGISLGAARAGFNVSACVELDDQALDTHAKNFPLTRHIKIDVSTLSGFDLLRSAGLSMGELDGLVGGPPCQGFSSIGKRSLSDSRNDLFGHFFRLVTETRPKFYVAENVPGILHSNYDEVRATAFAQLPSDYIQLEPIKISAHSFGAATTRTRVFFIGFDPRFFCDGLHSTIFSEHASSESVTVAKALTGLPVDIEASWQSDKSGWQTVVKQCPADPFFQAVQERIPIGIGHAPSVDAYLAKHLVSGCLGTNHTPEVVARFAATPPGVTEPISRAPRLRGDGFCPTLRAGTAKDRGSFQAVRPIHHVASRVITPREAARLQGFPDWFVFHPTKWHSFRQIGNSVSPLVAETIMTKIYDGLTY